MNIKLKKIGNYGFASLVEVVVTAIIFIIATGGILTTISLLRPQSEISSNRVEAAYIGKAVLDDLRKEVNASDGEVFWGPPLAEGRHYVSGVSYPPNYPPGGGGNTYYQVDYTVTDMPGGALKKVDLNVTW